MDNLLVSPGTPFISCTARPRRVLTKSTSCNAVVDQPMLSMAFWLKAWNSIIPGSYTVPQISKMPLVPPRRTFGVMTLTLDERAPDNYTTGIQAVTVVTTLFMAWSSDTWLCGRRWPMLVLGSMVSATVCLILASTSVFPDSRSGRWTLYYLTGFCQASNSMFWAWTQETLSGDPATRAFASAGLNVWASVSHAVIPLALFQTVDQPAVVAGNYGAAGFAFLHTSTALGLACIQHRRKGKDAPTADVTDAGDGDGADGWAGDDSYSSTRVGKSIQPDVRPASDVVVDDSSDGAASTSRR